MTTTQTQVPSLAQTVNRADLANPIAILFALLAGVLLLAASGVAQATVLHDAAHDQRHAMAFPCH